VPPLRREDWADVLAESGEPDVLLVCVGAMATVGLDVAERLRAHGIGVSVVDPRWVKPLHRDLVAQAARYRLVACVEDGLRVGGVGGALTQAVQDLDLDTPVRTFGVPTQFLDHAKRAQVLAEIGLTAQDISRSIVETVARRDVAPRPPAAAPAEQPLDAPRSASSPTDSA
jgi:1-deoxy-D-xylulose-5-phosphate synthase